MAFASDIDPWMVERGELIFSDSFDRSELKPWGVKHGEWTIFNGVLSGKELAKDNHIASIKHPVAARNMVIQFDFRFDGSPYLVILLNEDGQHNSRIVISPTDFYLQKYKDEADFKSFNLYPAECKADFAPGKWYTMLVEYCGDELVARVDDQHFIVARHPGLDRDRIMLLFPLSGQGASFDNVNVWKGGAPAADWKGKRTQLHGKQDARERITRDPITDYRILESRVRARLQDSDSKFIALVDKRVAIQEEMGREYPTVFGAGAKETKASKALKKDSGFRALVKRLVKAKADEESYLLKKDKDLKKCFPRCGRRSEGLGACKGGSVELRIFSDRRILETWETKSIRE